MPGIGTTLPIKALESSWADHAACADAPISDRHAPASIFFADIGRDPVSRMEVVQAKAYCLECPVQPECLEYAFATRQQGIWGGLTEKERLKVMRRRRSLAS